MSVLQDRPKQGISRNSVDGLVGLTQASASDENFVVVAFSASDTWVRWIDWLFVTS